MKRKSCKLLLSVIILVLIGVFVIKIQNLIFGEWEISELIGFGKLKMIIQIILMEIML